MWHFGISSCIFAWYFFGFSSVRRQAKSANNPHTLVFGTSIFREHSIPIKGGKRWRPHTRARSKLSANDSSSAKSSICKGFEKETIVNYSLGCYSIIENCGSRQKIILYQNMHIHPWVPGGVAGDENESDIGRNGGPRHKNRICVRKRPNWVRHRMSRKFS